MFNFNENDFFGVTRGFDLIKTIEKGNRTFNLHKHRKKEEYIIKEVCQREGNHLIFKDKEEVNLFFHKEII